MFLRAYRYGQNKALVFKGIGIADINAPLGFR